MAALAMSTISGPFPENWHWRSALELTAADVQDGAITEAPAHAHFDGEGHGRAFRTCVATLNNPSLAEAEEVEALTRTTSMSHIVCGFEVGASGTPHLQLTFTNDKPSAGRGGRTSSRITARSASGSSQRSLRAPLASTARREASSLPARMPLASGRDPVPTLLSS